MSDAEDRQRIVGLARTAFQAAIAEDWQNATDAVQQIGDEFGGDGVMAAALMWINTTIAHTANLPGDGRPVRLVLQEYETGRINADVSEVPPAVRWAGQLMAARANDDEATFGALVNSLATDEEFSEGIKALLLMTALQIRARQQAGGEA